MSSCCKREEARWGGEVEDLSKMWVGELIWKGSSTVNEYALVTDLLLVVPSLACFYYS